MTVTLLAFARVREVLGGGQREVTLSPGATVADLWRAVLAEAPALEPLRASTRTARNGRLVDDQTRLSDGDEVALLPPVGGG